MELIYTKPKVKVQSYTASAIKHGVPFRINDCPASEIFMRVKPTSYLLNSNLVVDCINRNKVFVINLEKGTLFIIEGDREVTIAKAALALGD